MDTICEALDTLIETDSDIQLPLLAIRWSENNTSADSDDENALAEGDIGNAFYQQLQQISGGQVVATGNEIYLLGDEDSNTDEFDNHVISHEFAHFLTANFSRYDAQGGEHIIGQRLDMRLAYEEGFADAFSGIALDSASVQMIDDASSYRDSFGVNQGRTFRFNLDTTFRSTAGWYSEGSVYSIIYNLFDDDNDSTDLLSLGFTPLFDVISSPGFNDSDALVSVFTFINHLKLQSSDDLAIDSLLAEQGFESIIDDYGSNETISNNDVASQSDILPIYSQLLENSAVTVCSNDQNGVPNKLSVTQFVDFTASRDKNYRFQLQPTEGFFADGLGSLAIYSRGSLIAADVATNYGDTVTLNWRLDGRYVIAVTHADNTENNGLDPGRRCFDLSVQ
ncbi:MAG: hypothetical protein ACJAYG_001209 [Oceanicoccus sp.]